MSRTLREILSQHYLQGLDAVACDTVFGTFDIHERDIALANLKQVPVCVALVLLRGGEQAIDEARRTAANLNLPSLGGAFGRSREDILAQLQKHRVALNALASTPNAIYADGASLKDWVIEAFIAANAVEEGSLALAAAWNTMWQEINRALAALPAAVLAKVSQVTGIPTWIFWGGGVLALMLGYGVVKSYLPHGSNR